MKRLLMRVGLPLLITVILLFLYGYQRVPFSWLGLTNLDTPGQGTRNFWLGPPTRSDADQQIPMKSALPVLYSKTNRWVVVRTDEEDSCDKLEPSFQDWNIVIVTNHHQHDKPDTRPGRCTYVSTAITGTRQEAFLLACELAIKNGAEMIFALFEVDNLDDVQPPVNAVYEPNGKLLSVQSSETLLNVDAHFGCSSTDAVSYSLRYSLCPMDRPAIQAFVNICSTSRCDETAPSVVLQSGQYGLVSLSNALYFPEAFWALPYTTKSLSQEQKIGLSLLTQKMLWMLGSRLMVHNSVGGLSTQCMKQSVNVKVLEALNIDKCKGGFDLLCFPKVLKFLQESSSPLSPLAEVWVHMLQEASNTRAYFKHNQSEAASAKCSNVRYYPISNGAVKNSTTGIRPANLNLTASLYHTLCSSQNRTDNSNLVNLAEPWTRFADILLIVVFNNPLYDVIPFIELLYRPMFPLILYCGSQEMSSNQSSNLNGYTLSFVTYETLPGRIPATFFYRCVSLAIEIGYGVSGYLTIADDTLLFPHKLPEFRKENIWFLPKEDIKTANMRTLLECKFDKCDTVSRWSWWPHYKTQALALLRTFQLQNTELTKKWHRQLVAGTGGEFRLSGAISDIFFIPRRLKHDFKHLASIFFEHEIFMEIAVPSIIHCLEKQEDVVPLPGLNDWGQNRDELWIHWTEENVRKTFIHPAKWSFLLSTDQGSPNKHRQMFCNRVLPFIHDRNAQFRPWSEG